VCHLGIAPHVCLWPESILQVTVAQVINRACRLISRHDCLKAVSLLIHTCCRSLKLQQFVDLIHCQPRRITRAVEQLCGNRSPRF
jgi:hypothetical protein